MGKKRNQIVFGYMMMNKLNLLRRTQELNIRRIYFMELLWWSWESPYYLYLICSGDWSERLFGRYPCRSILWRNVGGSFCNWQRYCGDNERVVERIRQLTTMDIYAEVSNDKKKMH